jgi:HSP20 family molecular chaperone IbpA
MNEAGRLDRGSGPKVASTKDPLPMTRLTPFSSHLLLGFEELEQAVDRVSKSSGDGYPPYNVEKVRSPEGTEVLRITLAVAGFGEDDIEIVVEENELVIRGRQKEDREPRVFLHRGIAMRQFQRTFVLAEGIEVLSARLEEGLLSIDLTRPPIERPVRKIAINRLGSGAAPRKE